MQYRIAFHQTRTAAKDYECLVCALKRKPPAERIILKGEKYEIVKVLALRGIGRTWPVVRTHVGEMPTPKAVLEICEVITRKQQRLKRRTLIEAPKEYHKTRDWKHETIGLLRDLF